VKYACIAQHSDEFPIRLMCRVLAVSPSGFYAWCSRAPSIRAVADDVLLAHVRVAFLESDGTYGSPRVQEELREHGHSVGKKRVARLMRTEGLVARPPRRTVRTTDSAHSEPVAPNLVARQFAPESQPALNRIWVSDLTFVPTRAGWLYLAVVLDLRSRRCVGWAMGARLEADLALSALRMALQARRPAPGLIHHSDRGVQYASRGYRALLAKHGAIASMSRRGDCWDNAVAESFFATLDRELIARASWATHAEARHAIFKYIETWYNTRRRHSSLRYQSPTNYERTLMANAAA
jgi:transposase InsO family protein